MINIDDFTIFSGADIIYKDLKFRQPKLIEIGKIGEQYFYECLSYFLLNKEKLLQNNKKELKNISTTYFIMLIILQQPEILRKINSIFSMVLDSTMIIDPDEKLPTLKIVNKEKNAFIVKEDEDWENIVYIIKQIFCIKGEINNYNVGKNKAAQRIAEMMMKAKKRLNEKKNSKDFTPILGQYCSIVSVGCHIALNEIINNYTIYQLMNQLKRFIKYEEYHSQINAMVHGAKIDNLTSWFGDLNKEDNNRKVKHNVSKT